MQEDNMFLDFEGYFFIWQTERNSAGHLRSKVLPNNFLICSKFPPGNLQAETPAHRLCVSQKAHLLKIGRSKFDLCPTLSQVTRKGFHYAIIIYFTHNPFFLLMGAWTSLHHFSLIYCVLITTLFSRLAWEYVIGLRSLASFYKFEPGHPISWVDTLITIPESRYSWKLVLSFTL